MPNANPLEKRLRVAGTLLMIGLLIEATCLLWAKPIAFVLFVAIGGLFLFVGVVVYLLSLVFDTAKISSRIAP
jgi:hypothetical protein